MQTSSGRPRARGARAQAVAIFTGVAAAQLGLLWLAGRGVPPTSPAAPVAPPMVLTLSPPVAVAAPLPDSEPAGPAEAAATPSSSPAAAEAPQPAPSPPSPSPRPARAPPPDTPVITAAPGPAGSPALPLLGGAELAGAWRAGGGAGAGAGGGGTGGRGGDCDMAARLERALAGDADIAAALVAARGGRGGASDAVLVWDGAWLQSPGQAGKGLAGVRQALAVEIAFAPAACREATVQGVVVLTVAAGPDAPRLALRAGRWRWRDLLAP